MSKSFYYKRKHLKKRQGPIGRNPSQKTEDLFTTVNVLLPTATANEIKDLSQYSKVPVSRLIAYAVDNEMDTPAPFTYRTELPDTAVIHGYSFITEGKKVFDYLSKAPTGLDRGLLLLARRDIGIMDKRIILAAIEDLLERGVIEEFKPIDSKVDRPDDYTKLRVVGQTRNPKGFKRIEGVKVERHTRVLSDGRIARPEAEKQGYEGQMRDLVGDDDPGVL